MIEVDNLQIKDSIQVPALSYCTVVLTIRLTLRFGHYRFLAGRRQF